MPGLRGQADEITALTVQRQHTAVLLQTKNHTPIDNQPALGNPVTVHAGELSAPLVGARMAARQRHHIHGSKAITVHETIQRLAVAFDHFILSGVAIQIHVRQRNTLKARAHLREFLVDEGGF